MRNVRSPIRTSLMKEKRMLHGVLQCPDHLYLNLSDDWILVYMPSNKLMARILVSAGAAE